MKVERLLSFLVFVVIPFGVVEQNHLKLIWNIGNVLNSLLTGCRYTRVKVLIFSPADTIFCNAAPIPPVQYFIYLISFLFCDMHRSQFFLIELALHQRFVQIFRLIDGSRCPFDQLDNA